MAILLGNGDGTFQEAVTYKTGSYPLAMAVGDFNGDGVVDIVTTTIDDSVSVLLGRGDGTFQNPSSFNVGPYPYALAVGDFNGDHNLDLVVGYNIQIGSVQIFSGTGDGTFTRGKRYPTPSSPNFIGVGDFNGDGKADMAITCSNVNFRFRLKPAYGDAGRRQRKFPQAHEL